MKKLLTIAALFLAACSSTGPDLAPVPATDAGCPPPVVQDASAAADAAPPVDPCLETDHTIVACMRGAGPFGWTALGACHDVPEKPGAGGNTLKRPWGLKDCVRLGYQDEELICCPEGQ